MEALLRRNRRHESRTGGDRGTTGPSIREVALLTCEDTGRWSAGQRIAWAGRSYTVAAVPRHVAGPALLRLDPTNEH